jgi:septal ring factor EnvC (AmiA/AmiB activator)
MDWTQALTVIGVFIGGFIYLMSKMDANQKESNTRFNGIENRLTAIEVETKNTNQRLSSIETENKDISKRLSNIEGYLTPNKVFHFDAPHKEDEPKEN